MDTATGVVWLVMIALVLMAVGLWLRDR